MSYSHECIQIRVNKNIQVASFYYYLLLNVIYNQTKILFIKILKFYYLFRLVSDMNMNKK